jgi:ABC-type amino acid transport substrate-binding protein
MSTQIRTLLYDTATIALLVAVGLLVWAGQQRPPDRYLQAIQSRGTLRVGLDPTYPPFEYISDGQVVGYDAQLARAIADDLGVRVQFVPMALDTLYDALIAGKVDVLISALPVVPERQAEVRYSSPYYQAGQVLVVRGGDAGAAIASVRDLEGRRVGVELGSNADTQARLLARTSLPGMRVVSVYRSPVEALSALARGELDAVITDNVSAHTYLRDHPGELAVLTPPLTDEPYVVAMPAKAHGLAAHIEATLSRFRAAGELPTITGTGNSNR